MTPSRISRWPDHVADEEDHAERLASPWQFPDRHLVEQEQQRIDALATAIVDQLKYEYWMRCGRVTPQ